MRSIGEILYNFHWVVPGEAARSAQPYAGFYGPYLRAHGIASIINLRGSHPNYRWWRSEKRVTDRLAILHLNPMLNSRRLPTKQMLINLFAAFDAAKHPMLIKCSGGQDRSSFASALFILHSKGWNGLEAARAQFAKWPYLHFPKQHQRWLRAFLDYAEEGAKGCPIAEWVASDYTPETFKAWLVAHELGDGFRGLYDKPGTAPGI